MRFITVKIKRLSKDPELTKHFNSGDFARKDYKYLYRVKMYRGSMRVFLNTPSLSQIWWTIKLLMWGPVRPGMPYEQHGHPVQLQVFSIEDVAKKYYTPTQVEEFKEQAKAKLPPIAMAKSSSNPTKKSYTKKRHKRKKKSNKKR